MNLTPIVAGAVMTVIGGVLRKIERHLIRLESFGFGLTFAFALNLVDFIVTR